MRTFYPPAVAIQSGGDKLRDRILEGYYMLSTHATSRMAERHITVEEVITCIKRGSVASPIWSERKDGYFCVTFYYGQIGEELIVPVRATFGDYQAKPIIITAYRNSTTDYVPEGELDDVEERIVVEKLVAKAPDDMTDEELEAALARRRDEKQKKVRQEAEARTQELLTRKSRLMFERNTIDGELAEVEAEMEKLR